MLHYKPSAEQYQSRLYMLNSDGAMIMRTFYFFCASFFIGICVWLGFRVLLLEYVYMPERALWLAKARMIKEYKYSDGDVVIIGSSRAMAINPEQLRKQYNVNAVNFSVGGATTPSTYFFLKRILKSNPNIKKVFLEFAPINMSRKDTDLEASLGENFIRYVASVEEAAELEMDLPGALPKHESIHSFPYSKFINMKDVSLLEGLVIRWRTGKTDLGTIQNIVSKRGFFLYPEKFTFSSDDQNNAFDRQADDGYKSLADFTRKIPPVTGIYYNKIVELLKEKNINGVIFFSPMYGKGLNYYNLGMGETYALFKSSSSVVNDNILVLEKEYFAEPSHVNKNGSEKFTDFFNMCITKTKCNNISTIKLFELKQTTEKLRVIDAEK